MFNFTGAAGPQRKVDLRGKSRAEESREEVIEKARLQREKRQRAKLEQKSAVIIQCTWRQAHTARRYAAALRAEWVEEYGALLNETQGGRCEALWPCRVKSWSYGTQPRETSLLTAHLCMQGLT